MLHSRLSSLLLIVGVVFLLEGCKTKPGDKCSGVGLPACADANTALVCSNSLVTALPCRGPKLCTSSASQVVCDNSLALPGDACDQTGDVACAVDRKAALECQNGKFSVAETCKGARGCEVEGDKISCDNDVAELGDVCRVESDYACTADKLMSLKCVAHKFEALNSCRGKDGCRVLELPEEKKTEFVCDDSLAVLADPCDTDGELACSMDKSALLRCKSGHFSKDRLCPKGCSFDAKGEQFVCDEAASPSDQAAAKPSAQAAPSKASKAPAKAAPKLAAKPSPKKAR